MKKLSIMILSILVSALFIASSPCFAQDIGVAWVGKSGMAKHVVQGFETAIKERAPQANIEYQKELAYSNKPEYSDPRLSSFGVRSSAKI